jgi:dihydropteroate synthase
VKKQLLFQVKGKKYDFSQKTWLMGVINTTPDSFSDGGIYLQPRKAIQRALDLITQGADIIDIGGESSRPGSESITSDEEKQRVLPVIRGLRKKTDILISIDTTKADVAHAALEEGADMINDISALRFDPQMTALAARKKVPIILMHMKGTPKNMQFDPYYENVFTEIRDFFIERISMATAQGINAQNIILDPGIGFGKRLNDNLALINNLGFLKELSRPVLIGVSRKSFIGAILDLPVEERLEGTIAASVLSMINGANILRVHDVGAVKRAIRVAQRILSEGPSELQAVN